MPYYHTGPNRIKRWAARVQFCNKSYWLGYHSSRYLAECAENDFKNDLVELGKLVSSGS